MPRVTLFERIAALQREGQPFVVATVVGRRPPVSAHLGDHAIVLADGRMEGFVGGACSREIVRKQALEALKTRQGRLVSIRPAATEPSESSAERVVVPMTCASEGAIDVFVEPVVRPRSVVVVGATPVADAVARLARAMEYDVTRVVDARDRPDVDAEATAYGAKVATLDALETIVRNGAGDQAAVVATQGHYDEDALEVILKNQVAYVGLVASRKRGRTVRTLLDGRDLPGLAALRSPAGLDLGARTPPEVALSILAEIVQVVCADRRPAVEPSPPEPATAVDPVCGMDVEVATARHVAEVAGVQYYFCCATCRARFLKDPQAFQPRAS